jgi:uncharacterized protein
MAFSTICYNLLMAAVDVAALAAIRRQRTSRAWLAALCGSGLVAGVAAVVFAEDLFGMARLAADGLFGHGFVLLVGSAIVLGRTHRTIAISSGLAAAGLMAVAIDAFLIEPAWLEVTHLQVVSPKLIRPIRLVIVADLQTGHFGPYERDVLRQAVDEKPDLLLLAGDYVQADWQTASKVRQELNAYLKEIHFAAPLGVFTVRGNVDDTAWAESFRGLPITIVHTTRSFDLPGLRLTCLSVEDSFNAHFEIAAVDSSQFHIVLGHCPDFSLGQGPADLLIAGHTHGGQVRMPLLGPVMSHCRLSPGKAAGFSGLPGGGQLFVSRGIGMERSTAPPMRFLCRPEVAVIDLLPENRGG